MSGADRLNRALGDRYAIGDELGRGGMATVYRAHDLRQHRDVAIKVLRAELAGSTGPSRFLREIEIAAALQHPHIVPVFDSGDADGLCYYVMPLVQGESLRHRLERDGPLPVDDALRIAREIGDALSYAHCHAVIHRDIKPENVLFESGHAVVTDFGVALALDAAESERDTERGVSLGTPAYMSPEQASAEAHLDARTDLYSLGCVLYEMLAGHPPFSGTNARVTMARHVADPVPPLASARPGIGRGLTAVVERALAKTPADRFATAGDFIRALADCDRYQTPPPAHSIAVLPFANLSPDPDNAYLGDGLSEEIINALTKIGFRVASRTSAFAFKDTGEDARVIGRRLGVRAILEGSIRRAGNRIRMTAQLINAEDGFHLWSERFDRDMQDVFAIQDEIASRIAECLPGVLDAPETTLPQRAVTSDVRAYEFYLRGRQLFHQFRRKALEAARRMFGQAIELDSHYALAHAGLADCCSYLYTYWGADATDLEQADRASRRALELDPQSAEAHAARGVVLSLSKDYEGASREFEQAIQLDANLYEARYFYARTCFESGANDRAVELFEQAAAIREDYQARFFAAQSLSAAGRTEEARAAYQRALGVTEEHLDLHPGDARATTMGAVSLCRLGERERGLRWADRAATIDPDDAGVSYNVACLYALEGEHDRAMACLIDAVEGGFWHKAWAARDPDLESLRNDPRFKRLLEIPD